MNAVVHAGGSDVLPVPGILGRQGSPIPRGDGDGWSSPGDGDALRRVAPWAEVASPTARANGSPQHAGDESGAALGDEAICRWCRSELPATVVRAGGCWCSKRCRQTAWRARRESLAGVADACSKRVAYADPPYPGTAGKYYGGESTYRGEVDHWALVHVLAGFDGWALSTSAKALRDVLPLCPPSARVAAWGKPIGVSSKTHGAHNTWEPVVYVPARRIAPGFRDWIAEMPARGGDSDLIGRKPLGFVRWVLRLLGAAPGIDELTDLYPGSGVVSRVWRELSRCG